MKKFTGRRSGFTMIEVSLVLAIGGLIFLMVFVALPSLQRNQRDARRREDMMTYLDALSKYQSNNRGALPSGTPNSVTVDSSGEWGEFYRKYLPKSFVDPYSGEGYSLRIVSCSSSVGGDCGSDEPNEGVIITILQATCDGEKAIKATNPRRVAVRYKLEGPGVYCGNS